VVEIEPNTDLSGEENSVVLESVHNFLESERTGLLEIQAPVKTTKDDQLGKRRTKNF
jgi:hypothetical protein